MLGFRPRSSLIARVLFDERDGTLQIWFRPSGHYRYDGVPRAVFNALAKAQSAGRYFNAYIKGRFTGRSARRRYPLEG